MSTAIPLLSIVALLVAIAVGGVAIWAGIEVAKAARSSRRLADDLDARVMPLADKLDVSVDAFNAELLRVDLIVNQLESAVDRFSDTAETVRDVVDAPIHLVNEVADRVRRGLRRRQGSHARNERPDSAEESLVNVVLLDESAAESESVESEYADEANDAGEVVRVDFPAAADDAPSVVSAGDTPPVETPPLDTPDLPEDPEEA